MDSLQSILIILGSILLLIWLAITVAALVIIWRLKKLIFGVMLALRGLSELNKQLQGIAQALRGTNRGSGRRAA